MSKVFYDHYISLTEVEKEINKIAKTSEEKEELWNIVDEIVHHKVMGCILDKLPSQAHEEFLSRFHEAPYDESLADYLEKEIGENVEELIKQEIGNLSFEILRDLKLQK